MRNEKIKAIGKDEIRTIDKIEQEIGALIVKKNRNKQPLFDKLVLELANFLVGFNAEYFDCIALDFKRENNHLIKQMFAENPQGKVKEFDMRVTEDEAFRINRFLKNCPHIKKDRIGSLFEFADGDVSTKPIYKRSYAFA